MNTSSRVVFALIASLLTACGGAFAGSWGEECEFSEPVDESLDGAGLTAILIDAEAGSLQVIGTAGVSEIRVRGQRCASSQKLLDGIELATSRRGDVAKIEVDIPDNNNWVKSYARLDLEIAVPADVPLEIDDGSGSMEVSGVASATIDDGSGSMEIRDVQGDVKIDDGSGSIRIEDVAGEVFVRDGSGEIDIRRAHSVVIDEDGSGSIDVAEIDGDVMVRDDGSGSIEVWDVGGDFTVRGDGSGGIRHDGVGGRVSIPSDD